MFRLLATTKCKRQQIAILIISFFAYVAGIRNEANNMLPLQQQQQQHQQTTIENSNYPSHPTNTNFRPSPIIDFTPADAAVPQQFKPTYIEPNPNSIGSNAVYAQKQEIENDNRRYTIEKAQAETVTYGNIAEKQFSFPNEQQQQYTPQHLTDKPIYIYRDPYTNENYHYTPTEAHVKETPPPPPPPTTTIYTNNNYNNNGYKQQYQNNDNQEYLVQSSMIVGTTQQHQPQQQPQKQQPVNPYRPYMSLSADKDVYLKRPGFVYDEKTGYKHPNSFTDKKSEVIKDKISYDSHDYPPPSYSQQQTSNFLPTPVPATTKPKPTPPTSSIQPFRQDFKATSQPWIFGQQQKPLQQQYLQSSLQSTSLPNYANNIDNYLLNKQPSADYYRTEQPPPSSYLQKQQQPQLQLQYEYEYDTRPSPYQPQQQQYDSRPPSPSHHYSQHPSYENVRPPPQTPPPSYFSTQQSQYPSSYENVPSSLPPSYLNAQLTQYPSYENVRPPPPPPPHPGRPSYNNYYDYQIGEVPPSSQEQSSQHFNYPYPRPPPSQYPYQGPYRPTPAPSQQQSGLATLVQYAPQFTSLLLNGVGGGGGSSNSPLGSLLGALTGGGTTPQQSPLNRRPINSQLIKALENIARNDDLQCVPKVLCQMIAGQTERGQLPAFITSPAITNFLAGFPAASPALIYGRAALLGLSGGEKSCLQTYVKCPKNEYEIIYYLNNHRGGFFKFFSEPEEQQQNVNHDATQQGATSLFSILAALTGTPAAITTTPRPRPTPKPQAPATDITSGIGNFFTQLLSDYMGGATVEYQRSFQVRRKRSVDDKIKFEGESADVVRFEQENHQEDVLKFHNRNLQNDQENHSERVKFQDENYDAYIDINQDHEKEEDEDFHDEEDDEDTQQGVEFQDDEEYNLDDTQGRILHKSRGREKRIKFFPQTRETPNENANEQQFENIIKKFNDFNRQRKLKFPSESQKREYLKDSTNALRKGKTLNDDVRYEDQQYGQKFTNYVENSYEDFQRDSKKIKFVDDNSQEQSSNLYSYYLQKPKDQQTKLVFPERQGKILNHPYYAASYLEDYYQTQQQQQHPEYEPQQDDKFVVPDNQRPSRYSQFPSTSSTNIYNTHINSQQSQNSFTSNTAVNNNIYVASSPGHREPSNNHFLPTPPPLGDTDYPSSNSVYSNSVFNSDKHHSNYNSLTQREFHKTQRYTSPTSSPSHSSSIAGSYKPQRYTSNSYTNTNNRYYRPSDATASYTSSHYTTTRRPYYLTQTTKKSDDKNIYVTNSRGVTEYYLTPDGRKVYL